MDQRKLYRSRSNKMIAGVCGGIAEYFGIDPTVVRLAAVALLLLGFGSVGLVYLIMMIVVPEEPFAGTPEVGYKGGTAGEDEVPPPPPAEPTYATPVPPVYTPPPAEGPRRQRPPGATAGIVLVIIGVIFLAGQFVPGLAWWNLWPLIIIVAGVVQAVTPGREGWSAARLFDGLVTVAWGMLFLAITSGVVEWSVFAILLSLWPVLLIAIGFEILGKAVHSTWIRALGSLAIIAALVYAVALGATGQSWSVFPIARSATGETATISEPVGTIDEAELKLDAGAATVTLESGDRLVEAEGQSPWGTPQFSVEQSGDTARVRLESSDSEGAVWWPGRNGSYIDAKFSPDVIWDMNISVGATDMTADLSDLQVRSLELKPGVADCSLRLGEVPTGIGEATAEVKAGVSTVKIEVPADAEVRVESDSGLTAHDIGGDLEQVGGGVWETPGFAEARDSGEDVWVINLKSGVGSVELDTY